MENELITDITNDLKDTISEKQLEKIVKKASFLTFFAIFIDKMTNFD